MKNIQKMYAFSYYFAGIRVSDVIKIGWEDIYDGRFYYRMNKNSKLRSLKISEIAWPILDSYIEGKQIEGDFVFPEMEKENLKDTKDIYAKTKTQ